MPATLREEAWHGIDTVIAHLWGPVTLPSNIENLVLSGKGSTTGTGNALANTITAGTSGALIDGRDGNDTLIGGGGADVFKMTAGNGSDTIRNFTSHEDVILFSGYGIKSIEGVLSQAQQVGDDVVIGFGGERHVIADTLLADLSPADFGFAPRRSSEELRDIQAAGQTILSGANTGATANGWYVINNTWGAGDLVYNQDYSISAIFDKADMTSGVTFDWRFPYTAEYYPDIQAFPELQFGVNPNGAHTANPTDQAKVLPVKVADIANLDINFDVALDGTTSGFNTAFDMWFTSKPYGDASTVTNEVMVWVHKGEVRPFGTEIGTYSQGSATAKIYHTGTYTAVVFDQDILQGQLDADRLFQALQSRGILSGSEYLASIDFGAEVVSGVGSLTIDDLDFKLDTRAADGSIVSKTVDGSNTTVARSAAPLAAAAMSEGAAPALDPLQAPTSGQTFG